MKEFDDHIESALKKEITFQLPENFSDKVINLILARAEQERGWEIAGIISVVILFMIALGVTWYFTRFTFSLGALTFLTNHIGLIAFGVLFIVFLHLVDKKLIRKHQVN